MHRGNTSPDGWTRAPSSDVAVLLSFLVESRDLLLCDEFVAFVTAVVVANTTAEL